VGLERQAAYCASKGGVEQLTRGLAIDWAKQGVRVNAIAYGFIETDLTAGVRANEYISGRLLGRTPMVRYGSVEEVAGAAVFLASPAAAFVTGVSLAVDGGWTAG
jgi:gluconate 5-dehydrogenase